MQIKKELCQYLSAKDKLTNILGFYPNYDVDYYGGVWYFDYGQLTWYDKNEEYSEEANLVKKFDDYSIFKVYSCTGDKYYLVVDNSGEH